MTHVIRYNQQMSRYKRAMNQPLYLLDKHYPSNSISSYNDLMTFVKDRPGHDFRYSLDIKKPALGERLPFEPKSGK